MCIRFKEKSFQIVVNVLSSFKSDIDSAVKSLDVDLIDVLMKYIYKGFEKDPKNSSIFLNWHEKVRTCTTFRLVFHYNFPFKGLCSWRNWFYCSCFI